MRTIIITSLLVASTTMAFMMPHPNQPRRVQKLAQRRAMALQQGPPDGGDGGPPDGGGGGGGDIVDAGNADSDQCTTTDGTTCAFDGSTNYVSRNLTWDASTGKFSGTIISNLCSNNAYGFINYTQTQNTDMQHTADCKSQTFPSPSYATTPIASPLLGSIGYSLYGVYIYGPFEAGFTTGQACNNGLGDCDGGVDIGTCEDELKYECGADNVDYTLLIDTCGGHADSYHYHLEMECDEKTNANATTDNAGDHSPLVGVLLDGRGLYGAYESGTTMPTDLDACGGHWGPVPGSNLSGVEHDAAANVYHYHAQKSPPYLAGCFGPVDNITECRSLYSSTCGSTITVTGTDGVSRDYDDDCPCYDSTGSNVVATDFSYDSSSSLSASFGRFTSSTSGSDKISLLFACGVTLIAAALIF